MEWLDTDTRPVVLGLGVDKVVDKEPVALETNATAAAVAAE